MSEEEKKENLPVNEDSGGNSFNWGVTPEPGWEWGDNRGGVTPVTPGDTRDEYQYRQDLIDNYQEPAEPMWDPASGQEAPRAWNVHYTPSWFVEEQANRKNPDYKADSAWTNEQIDAIANYVSGKKKANPQEWRYGDPGWDTSTQLWNETIKPHEDEYEAEQKKTQAVQMQEQPQQQQPPKSKYYAFHNNQMMTTDLAIRQEGNNLAPVRTQAEIDRIKASSPYQLHNVDKSNADYESLSRSGKTWFNVMPSTAGTDVKNRKWYQRYTQPVLGAVMSASGPATIGKLLVTAFGGPAGLVYGAIWGASAGYSYLKGTGTIQGNKYIDKFMELSDIMDEKGAQFQGALAYGFEKAGGGDLTDWSKFGENLAFLVDNFDTIIHYAFAGGKASSDYNKDVVGIVTGLTPNMGANILGLEGQGASRLVRSATSQLLDNPEDKVWLERNQTTRSNIGKEGVYEIPEELLGTNAITYWLNYGQYLYDNGVTNPQQLELEISTAMADVYGDLFNASEFIEHEIGDPGNIAENMQSRAMYGYAKITGDENLANAAQANTNSLIGDLTGNIPVIPDVMRFFAKLAGNNEFLKTSGGIDEIINTWDMENLRSTDPSQLTARDRRISGINPDGSLKSMDTLVDPNTIKNPFARGAEKIKQLFQTTPEWRASMSGDAIMNFISTGIEDALSARPEESADARIKRVMTFVDELEHPETISDKSPFSQSSKTILFNSIKDDLSMAVRSHRAQIDKVIADYANLEPNRQVLNQLAKALGLTPEKVMDKYQNEKTVLAQMIINKADQNGGTIPEITFADGTPIPVDSKEFGDRVISMISPFAGDNAKAYDPRLLMTQITSAISDGVTETLINKYNIQEEGWVYRFGDTVKKMQHLWLLGLSPSYLANNFTNNVLTRSALGYGGFLTGKTINSWMDRFGWRPERLEESMAEGVLGKKDSKTSAEKMRAAIREKRKGGNKFFDNVDKKLDWVSEHAGFFGAISGKIEELESRQIYASAMMTYMARTWKPGVNFRKMDPQLENLIDSKVPGMSSAIYAAISAGVSMKEIERAIYGSFVIPNIRDTLIDAARNIGITNAEDVIIETFDKCGAMTELMEALQGKRGEEVDAVIKKVSERIQKYADLKLKQDVAGRSDQTANNANGYGFAEAVSVGQNLAQDMGDLWVETQNANTQLFDRRLREGMSASEFHDLYQKHQNTLNERWAGIYATAQQEYLGILKGLGFLNDTANKYVNMMVAKNNLWTTFYQKTQPQLFQPYLDALVWQTDDTFEKWDSRVKAAWNKYKEASDKAYAKTIEKERKQQEKMDALFADGLKAALGNLNAQKVDEVIVPLQEEIRNIRQQIIDKNLETRNVADKSDVLNEKSIKYHETDAEREGLKKRFTDKQKELYDAIRELGPKTEPQNSDSAAAEVDHDARILNDITQREAEEAKRVAEQLADSDADDVAETGDMPKDVDDIYRDIWQKQLDDLKKKDEEITAQIDALIKENNTEKNLEEITRLNRERGGYRIQMAILEEQLNFITNPSAENWSTELTRKNLYKVAKQAGAEDDLAVAYSQLNKIHADEWESNHPGRKYFRDAGGMTVSFTNENRTVPIRGVDGKMYQVETIERADVNTPEFEAWHGDNPENFNPDGTPLAVWHGSNAWFPNFRKDLLGSFTNAVSAKMGFFFSSNKKNSEHYVTNNGNNNRFDLANQYLYNALNIDFDRIYSSAADDIEWASKNKQMFPNGLADYINPDDILKEAESINNKYVNEFGENASPLSFEIELTKAKKGPYEDLLASIQSGEKKLDADEYEPYWKNLQEYIDSYGFVREKYSAPSDVTRDVLDKLQDEYREIYYRFLNSGIEIDYVFPDIKYALEELRYPSLLDQNQMLYIANTLQYYNAICSQLLSDTFSLDVLGEDEMQLLLTGKDLTSETVYGEKRTNADYLRILESEYFESALLLDLLSKALKSVFLYDDISENYNRILNSPESPNLREFYLSFKKPYIVDYKKRNRADVVRYSQAIRYAINNGYDAVILKNTYDPKLTDIYVVFNEDQMKSVFNSGEWSDPQNFYHQEEQFAPSAQESEPRIKGQFSIQDGKKLVELFRGSDISTLIHETMGHAWATTLNDNQIEALAAYNGWTADRYRQLEHQWYYEPDSMSEADRTAWIDAQERFAYGFEQYLLEGKAPNDAMKEIFETFRKYLLKIYQGVRHLVYKGEEIDIHKAQHGVTLAEIFDSMLVDSDREFNIQRTGLADVDTYSISDAGRQFLNTDLARRTEKIKTMTADAENAMRLETQTFLEENKKWGLTEEEQVELVTEMMHDLGLNQDLPENVDLMNSIQAKLNRFPGGEKAIRKFIEDHRPTAARINDSAMDAMLKNSQSPWRNDDMFKYVLNQVGQEKIGESREAYIAPKENDPKEINGKQLFVDENGSYVFEPKLSGFGNGTAVGFIKTADGGMEPVVEGSDVEKMISRELFGSDDQKQAKKNGNYVMQTKEFKHGAYTCDRIVYRNNEAVAYLPEDMQQYDLEHNGNTVKVIGLSIQRPDQCMYLYNDEVFEEPVPQKKTENVMTGDAEDDSLGALDPEPQANHKITYEKTIDILNEFGRVYKNALNDAMGSKMFSALDAETKELVRQYIDNDIRSDLMNTKYKTGKFGEIMRDAALLNYSKRYGFDNALTLLFPYQFWQTRSAWNWIQRMGGKGGKMWRRYARLKELEERNKKELMPSSITGKVGIYLPFLPDWMGDALFMPTSQLSVVGNFMDPLDDWLTDNKAVNATAERYVQEAFEANDISLQEYRDAMDPAKRNGSAVWQEMYARAQANGDHDRDLGTLFKQYFGMSLPVSVGKALIENNPEGFTQLPMTRAGTAFRAMFGDNIVGKGLEFAMSAPERALRKAAVAITGNNDFRYQEFGNWGDYYIRNQVWDMVVEGRISPEQAITAQEEKDGNKIWDEAAERQRMELLQKTQILSATMPFKKAVEDIKTGNQDKLGDDIKYLFAEILTMWTPTSVVRSAERTWREDKAEMSKLYDTNDKKGQQKFYDDHKYYSYNNLRYEDNPEQALRSYLYKSINDTWYDLSKSEQDELKLALGTDFQRSILDKETRAYQTMDLTRLAAYAQALNGSIPFLATDSLNTTNVPKINTNVVPMSEKVSREIFFKERERLYPGMADVSNIYYQLPVEDRKYFRQANPNLDKYWAWKKQYETDHPEVKNFSKRMSDYYDTLNAENVCSQLDEFTIKELNRAAYAKRKVDKIYEPIIIRAMYSAGVTDDYDSFVKVLTNYILGE